MKKQFIPILLLVVVGFACSTPTLVNVTVAVATNSPTTSGVETIPTAATTVETNAPAPTIIETDTPAHTTVDASPTATTAVEVTPTNTSPAILPTDPEIFVQVASADNISANYTYIDNSLTNNNPNAVMFVTQNWNPGGFGNIDNSASIGVWFDGNQWAIFNQDQSAMPINAAFNVWIPTGEAVFVHTATASNITAYYTHIDNPLTNGNPDLMLQVTQNWNPGGIGGTYNIDVIGVWYDEAEQKWAIFNENSQTMPENAAFNVLVPFVDANTFLHVATDANSSSNYTLIDNPLTNGNPNALLQVTANWNPGGGAGGIYDTSSLGVWYDRDTQKWSIFNEDESAIPIGAAFNVIVNVP